MIGAPRVEDLLREYAPQVLGALVRRYGHFDLAEDATQEALLAAAMQWRSAGVPDNPRGWLIAVAARKLTDLLRADQARRRREDTVMRWPSPTQVSDQDDSLILLTMCCHPALTPESRIALTLRAVGGLTTAEVARAFLVPEATMTRRITRAKQTIKNSGIPFTMPADGDLSAVCHVLYLIFNEGYSATSGPYLARAELTAEAIRLTRMLFRLVPEETEIAGLLALMLLTDARRPARMGPDGGLIPMEAQDRTLWHRPSIAEGTALITATLPRGVPGPYQLQAAIAAVHDEAATWQDTDWPQIVGLYELLLRQSDNPMVALNHAVAVGMARGPLPALELIEPLRSTLDSDHRLHAVRGHLLEMAGSPDLAKAAYLRAADLTTSLPQRRYLHQKAVAIGD
ncbi:RNA polymerase sigma factor [Catelliglobosispora koreensis]|uniref:RNA polymerase sigma factor n=1 Tax=Catelliglobosispora koreensis TaxID=129052 RepID=UPI00036F9B61|nr:sigma-70 family RNA polymerase sigma factor [Catelliglobosispora koreensis]